LNLLDRKFPDLTGTVKRAVKTGPFLKLPGSAQYGKRTFRHLPGSVKML
jgi:hypothetical protein